MHMDTLTAWMKLSLAEANHATAGLDSPPDSFWGSPIPLLPPPEPAACSQLRINTVLNLQGQ